jgi:hypothetical protein
VWQARTCTSCGATRFATREIQASLSSSECNSKLLRRLMRALLLVVLPSQGAVTLERVLQSGEGLDALAEVLGAENAEAAFGQFAASLLMAVNAMHVDGVVHRGARASVERASPQSRARTHTHTTVRRAATPAPQRFDTNA